MLVPAAALPARADDDMNKIVGDVAGAQERLTELAGSTEAATEAFNAGRLRLATAEEAASAAADSVQRADTAVRAAVDKRRALGSIAYQSGGLEQLSVLLSGDPGTALDRAGAMDALARRGQTAEVALRSARHDLTDARAVAEATLDEQRRQVASLEEQKKRITASVAAQQVLLDELVARQADLVRQAQELEAAARQAREQTAAEAAAVQAQQAAAEQERLRSLSEQTDRASRGFTAATITASMPPAVSGGGGAAVAVAEARAQLGKPYVWAAAGPDTFDCSGLTQWVWAKAGVALSHFTGAQWNEGRRISRDELIPGDLVFFGADLHHVGIYIGDGEMIDAPRTGTVIRIEPVWWTTYVGAVRPGG
ncbi:C40 family peptidase [Frankia sp. Cppng1_Ct_nod]|uniref:C40 family peptidase n=1 Tax=Frankia sp. Cppng1_Ct_nod TaxID=2897162 RepID=UPI0010419056|nr:C40 family peptidase [Frankia sp. Cppng1_Ct_nod]